MLTVQQLKDCMTREPYLMESDEGNEIFDLYVDVMLAKSAGKAHWGDDHRHTKTVSKAVHEDQRNKPPCVTPGMEAMLVMFVENLQYRVACLVAERKGQGAKYQHIKTKHDSPYTIPDGGQLPWGGWSDSAREAWKALRDKARDARGRGHVDQMEQECLTRLRIKHGKEADPAAAGAPAVAAAAKSSAGSAPAVDSDIEYFD